MTNVIERMPEQFRGIFADILQKRDNALLAALRGQEKPTPGQRQAVNDIFVEEIMDDLATDGEPTAGGQLMKRTIEEFWYLWPSDRPL